MSPRLDGGRRKIVYRDELSPRHILMTRLPARFRCLSLGAAVECVLSFGLGLICVVKLFLMLVIGPVGDTTMPRTITRAKCRK